MGALAVTVSAALVASTLTVLAAGSASADVATGANGNFRTSWDSGESTLGPETVQTSSFGTLFAKQLDGQIYAQPLVVGDEVIAVTESNTAYGLDRTTGKVLWSSNYGTPWPASAINCGDLAPNVGATATPVYDPVSDSLYFTTKVDGGTDHKTPAWLMHAVDPASGAERAGWPVTIAGSPVNDRTTSFNAFYEQQRPGLLLLNGTVYAGFGSHCDVSPYRGYVVGVSTTAHAITSMWTTETGAGASGAGIWQAGGGLVSDGDGRIFFSTGNGLSPAPGAGTTVQGTLAESVVRLQVGSDGTLSTADFFSPSNAPTLDLKDQDIASGAPLALPDGFGTTAHPHLLVQQGKDGRVFLLDRDNLGGMGQGSGGGDAAVSVSGPYQGQWGHPAFWGGDGGYVYLVGNNGPLRALKYSGSGSAIPRLTSVGTSADTFGYTSGSPVVTSNGTDESSALVWVVSATGSNGANGTLRAYSPVPDSSGVLQLLWSAPIGTATKFATPTTDRGNVYVGTRDGVLYGFGSPAATAVTASPLDFGKVAVGQTAAGTMTLTATEDVTITGVTTAGAFSATGTLPTTDAPQAVASGGTLDIPVVFAPTATGGVNGLLSVTLTDSQGVAQKLAFALHGIGTRPGLGALPATLAFGEQPTGTTTSYNVQITNTGTTDETIAATTMPADASYTVTGLPAVGTSIAAGDSVVATVSYAPTAAGTDSDSLTVTSTADGADGPVEHTLAIPLAGTAVTGYGHLEFSTTSLAFGNVPLGSSKTLSFTITNTGNIPVTVTKAKAPTNDFGSAVQLSEGLVIGPDTTAVQSVTYTPTAAGAATAAYEVTGDGMAADGTTPQGAQYVQMSGAGSGTAVSTSSQDGGWRANGAAQLTADGGFQLTSTAQNQKGSAVRTLPVLSDGLRATFAIKLGPGTGGNGMAFALLDSTATSGTSLGAGGRGLGLGGLPGTVVSFTEWNAGLKLHNAVAIGTSTAASSTPTYVTGAVLSSSLREGVHRVDIAAQSGVLTVWVDGVQTLSTAVALPRTALVAFGGSTSDLADLQTVSRPVIAGTPVTGYRSVPLTRAMPTRSIAAHGRVAVALAGHYGIPANATSVLVDLGVSGTHGAASGRLTLQTHNGAIPSYGTLFWNSATQSALQSVSVKLTGGAVDIYNGSTGAVSTYLDVIGYQAPAAGPLLHGLRAADLLNTATGTGQTQKAALAAHGTASVQVTGKGGVPTTATAVVLHLSAAASASSSGGLIAWPHGSTRPGPAQLIWDAKSSAMSNLVTVPIGSLGRIDLYNTGAGAQNVEAAVVGYYGPAGGRSFVPVASTAVLDTRVGLGRAGTAPLAAQSTLKLNLWGKGGVPKGATAVLLQLGGIPASGAGTLTAWNDGVSEPAPANLVWTTPGRVATDLAVVPLSSSGVADIRNNGSTPAAAFATVVGYYVG